MQVFQDFKALKFEALILSRFQAPRRGILRLGGFEAPKFVRGFAVSRLWGVTRRRHCISSFTACASCVQCMTFVYCLFLCIYTHIYIYIYVYIDDYMPPFKTKHARDSLFFPKVDPGINIVHLIWSCSFLSLSMCQIRTSIEDESREVALKINSH